MTGIQPITFWTQTKYAVSYATLIYVHINCWLYEPIAHNTVAFMCIYSQIAWAIGTINIQVALYYYGHKGLMKIQPINSPVIMAIKDVAYSRVNMCILPNRIRCYLVV
jgi:hypothetical protein